MGCVSVIGLCGAAGCGKDTLADELVKRGWVKLAFADALKEICVEFLGLSHDDVLTQEGKARYNEFWGMTNREILQRVGTDAFRNGFHRETWIKIAERRIASASALRPTGIVVSDVRFDNEAEMIRRIGGSVVRIVRPGSRSMLTDSERVHPSENGVDDGMVDFVLRNDSTVEEMVMRADGIIRMAGSGKTRGRLGSMES